MNGRHQQRNSRSRTLWRSTALYVMLAAGSGAVQAANWTAAPGQIVGIEEINGGVYIEMDSNANNVNGCTLFSGSGWGASGGWFLVPFGGGTLTDSQRTFISSLQAAQVSGKVVVIFSAGCSGGGTAGYNTIDGLYVRTN